MTETGEMISDRLSMTGPIPFPKDWHILKQAVDMVLSIGRGRRFCPSTMLRGNVMKQRKNLSSLSVKETDAVVNWLR